MDIEDEKCGRTDEIHQQLQSAYCQFSPDATDSPDASGSCEAGTIADKVDLKITNEVDIEDCSKKLENQMLHPTLTTLPDASLKQVVTSDRMLATLHSNESSM